MSADLYGAVAQLLQARGLTATLKALQEYSNSKRDRKNKPQYKMFMKLFRY